MQLKHLIQEIAPTSVEGTLNREISGISHDSRRISPGMLFVAIPGQTVDGHDYISSAIDRGAVAVLCQCNGFISRRATKIQVPDVRKALALVATAYFHSPSSKLRMGSIWNMNCPPMPSGYWMTISKPTAQSYKRAKMLVGCFQVLLKAGTKMRSPCENNYARRSKNTRD